MINQKGTKIKDRKQVMGNKK